MNSSIYRISLDIHDTASQVSLSVKKGDTNRKIIAVLTEGGKPYKIADDVRAVFRAKKPADSNGNRAIVYNDAEIVDNAVCYALVSENTEVAGVADCEFTLYGQSGEVITSPSFTLIIYKTVNTDGEVEEVGSNELSTLANLIAEVQGVLSSLYDNSNKIGYVNLRSAGWQGTESPYSQVVTIDGITENSKIDINPSVEQLAVFHEKDLAFVAENEDGVVTVFCVGQKPTNDYTMQVTITEVVTNG